MQTLDPTQDRVPEEVVYKLPRKFASGLPGSHHGRQRGNGFEFQSHVVMGQGVDPRRFDARATLRDPLGRVMVRTFTEPTRIPVMVLGDLSASMRFRAQTRKLDLMADFVAALGLSTHRVGDPFGFFGFDNAARHDFLLPPGRTGHAPAALAARLREFVPEGGGAEGLIDTIRLLDRRPSLVFLVSDFYFPARLLNQALGALSRHAVVPTLLIDSAETERLPRFGIARMKDPETALERTVLFRPSFNAKLRSSLTARRERLAQLFARHELRPLRLRDRFVASDVTNYFHGSDHGGNGED